jgi:hypothetical protein
VTFWQFDGTGGILREGSFHLNHAGLISHSDDTPEPRPGEFRIVVLGDESAADT